MRSTTTTVEGKQTHITNTLNNESSQPQSIENLILSCYSCIKPRSLPLQQKEVIYTATKRCINYIIRHKRFGELAQLLLNLDQLDKHNPTRIKIFGILNNTAAKDFLNKIINDNTSVFPKQRPFAIHNITEASLKEPVTIKTRHPLDILCGRFYFNNTKKLLNYCECLIIAVIYFKEDRPDRALATYKDALARYHKLPMEQKQLIPEPFEVYGTEDSEINKALVEKIYTLGKTTFEIVEQQLKIAMRFNDYEAFQAIVLYHNCCMRNHILDLKIKGANLYDIMQSLQHIFKQIHYADQTKSLHPGPGHALSGYVMDDFHIYIYTVKMAFEKLNKAEQKIVEQELIRQNRDLLIDYLHTTIDEELHNHHAHFAASSVKLLRTAKELKQQEAFKKIFINAGFPKYSKIFYSSVHMNEPDTESLYQCRYEYNLKRKFIKQNGEPNLYRLPYKKLTYPQPY